MKFNKSLDWLKESDEDDNLLEDDSLDIVDEEVNEGLYVDPANYDKHSDLVDVVDKAGNAQKMTQDTYNKNKGSGEFEKKEPEELKEKEQDKEVDKEQSVNSFEDIPYRNNADWKTASDYSKKAYDNLVIQMFHKKKLHDSHVYGMVQAVLDNNLDGAIISSLKEHIKETPEIAKALKDFDDALQEKDLKKSWQAYQSLWDAHRDATKRKYDKKNA